MSDLRARIAAALASKEVVLDGDHLNETSAWLLADAVIAELKSKPFDDFSYGPDEEGYHVDVTWVAPGAIAKMLGQTD